MPASSLGFHCWRRRLIKEVSHSLRRPQIRNWSGIRNAREQYGNNCVWGIRPVFSPRFDFRREPEENSSVVLVFTKLLILKWRPETGSNRQRPAFSGPPTNGFTNGLELAELIETKDVSAALRSIWLSQPGYAMSQNGVKSQTLPIPASASPFAILLICDVLHPVDDFAVELSWIAMCVIAVVCVAPCQCFSPGSNHTTSPGRISSMGPPSRCTHQNLRSQSILVLSRLQLTTNLPGWMKDEAARSIHAKSHYTNTSRQKTKL